MLVGNLTILEFSAFETVLFIKAAKHSKLAVVLEHD